MLFCPKPSARVVVACSSLLVIFLLAACGGGSRTTTPPPNNPVVPTITVQPQNQTVTEGQTATFSITATGTAPLSYQWMKGGNNISGAISSSYTTAAASTTDSGSTFSVKVSNSVGSVTSSTVILTVNAAPVFAATIDFGSTRQTIRGFGGSTAWHSVSNAQADTLFGTLDNQLGLSMLRVRIDPSSTTGGTNWAAELANAQKAQTRGATVFASPWTPPAEWKTGLQQGQPFSSSCDKGPGYCGGSLDPARYADYANYLESFVTYMHNGGVELSAISMQNEPDWVTGYESCSWTAAQIDSWIAQNASVLSKPLIMPESMGFNKNLSDPALNDSNAVGKVGIIGGHLYGVSPSAYYADPANNKGKDVWMTEWAPLQQPAGATTISDGLTAAKNIHDSLITGGYNAYVWWWMMNANYALLDSGNNPTYFGYALAQYSKFVRPGYVRVNATANPGSGVYISAYSGSGHYVIVAVNNSASLVNQTFTIQGQTLGTLTPYQTNSTLHISPQSGVTVLNGQFTYMLPAQSIITFVQ